MEKVKSTNQLKVGTTLSLVAVACVAMLLALGQAGESVTHASPSTPNPGNCPIPPCTRLIGPEGREFCECPPTTPTSTPLAYGPKGIGDDWHLWATPTPAGTAPGTNLDALDFDWYYDWRVSYLPQRENDPRYVRMVWCQGTSGVVAAASEDYSNGRRGRVWLIYNEPDHPGQCGGKRLNPPNGPYIVDDPVGAALHFSYVAGLIKGADPHARVFAGGLVYLNSTKTRNWWSTFISTLSQNGNLSKLQGVHVHLYPLLSHSTTWHSEDESCNNSNDGYCVSDLAQAANQWYQDMHIGLGLENKPIWITEMGWLKCWSGPSYLRDRQWVRDNFMIPMSQWFAENPAWPYDPQVSLNPGYEAVGWYVTRDLNDPWYSCNYLLNSPGTGGVTTELGQFWNAYQP